jgi:hypothetical protein
MSIDKYRAKYEHTSVDVDDPPWSAVEAELSTMDNFAKPALWLFRDRNMPDGNCLAVCGGSGVYHVQVADEGADWKEAFDPSGSNDTVEVWRSDQGFAAEAKKTWALTDAVKLVRWYFETGTRHPEYSWV